MSRARCCLSHCSGCGSCFHSDEAFDLHRGGNFRDASRRCWPEDAEDRLEPATENGICEISAALPRVGVTVWRRKRSVGSAGEVFSPSGGDRDREAA